MTRRERRAPSTAHEPGYARALQNPLTRKGLLIVAGLAPCTKARSVRQPPATDEFARAVGFDSVIFALFAGAGPQLPFATRAVLFLWRGVVPVLSPNRRPVGRVWARVRRNRARTRTGAQRTRLARCCALEETRLYRPNIHAGLNSNQSNLIYSLGRK